MRAEVSPNNLQYILKSTQNTCKIVCNMLIFIQNTKVFNVVNATSSHAYAQTNLCIKIFFFYYFASFFLQEEYEQQIPRNNSKAYDESPC